MAKLYVVPLSVNCQGLQVLVAEAGLQIETVILDPTEGKTLSQFEGKNLNENTPLFENNGEQFWDFVGILRALCKSNSLESWYPSDTQLRTALDEFLQFRENTYIKAQSELCYPVYGWSTEVVQPETARQTLHQQLEFVALSYLKEGQFLCGMTQPSIADLSFAVALTHLSLFPDFRLPDIVTEYLLRFEKMCPSWISVRTPLEALISTTQLKCATPKPKVLRPADKKETEATFDENDFVELFGLSNAAFNGQTGLITGYADGRFQIKLLSRELVRIKPTNIRKTARPELSQQQSEEAKREQAMIHQQNLENSREARFRLCADVKDRKYHFRTYPHCFVGKDTVSALVDAGFCKTRADAVAYGNKVMETGVFFHVMKEHIFKDERLFYRFATSECLLNVGPRFWNVRGSFKVKAGGVEITDAGTHMSIVQLPNGNFVVLDTIELSDAARKEIDELTDKGRKIEAVFGCHPYHTLWFPSFYQYYPNAKYYGCPRHLAKITSIKWAGCFIDSAVRKLYEPYLFFRISQGCEFLNPAPDNHFASVVAFHKESATLHTDDTFMYWSSPNLLLRMAGLAPNTLSFHLTMNSNCTDPLAFKAWVQQLLHDWEFDNICAAHTGNRIGGGKRMLAQLLVDSEPRIQKLAAERAKGIAPSKPTPEECGRTEGDECG